MPLHNSLAQGEPPRQAASALISKLDAMLPLSAEEIACLEGLPSGVKRLAARSEIIARGEALPGMVVIRDGWVFRYRLLEDGRRQILSFLLPGDCIGLYANVERTASHSVATLTEAEIGIVPAARIEQVYRHHPRLAAALSWCTDYSILSEQVLRLGRQTAYERLANLLLELRQRLQLIGRSSGDGFALPVTQEDLADTLGLSIVHVNRTLKRLRQAGLITLKSHHLAVLDPERLGELAEYTPCRLGAADGCRVGRNGRPRRFASGLALGPGR